MKTDFPGLLRQAQAKARYYAGTYLGFSAKEANAFTIWSILLVLSGLFALSRMPGLKPVEVAKQHELDSLYAASARASAQNTKANAVLSVQRPFDPNHVDALYLENIGIPPKMARRWANYVNKGGRFRKNGDLLKLYGMDTALYVAIAPFLLIENMNNKSRFQSDSSPQQYAQQDPRSYTRQQRQTARFDINEADTSQLQSVRGIGSKLSARIVKFREALGGFVSINQLAEVYGLKDEALKNATDAFFVAKGFRPKVLGVDTAGWQSLISHPYVGPKEAKAILAYRKHHGLASLDALRNIPALDSAFLLKTQPYLGIVSTD